MDNPQSNQLIMPLGTLREPSRTAGEPSEGSSAGTQVENIIRYCESLTVTQGPRTGERFKVLPWQKRFIKGFVANPLSALSVARGNGKTTFLAGIAAAYLSGPLARDRGEILLVAGSFDQAKVNFDHILSFLGVEKSNDRYRIWDSPNKAEVQDRLTGCSLKCHGSNPRLLHGRAPHLVLGDEPTQWQHTQADRMVSALLTSLGKHHNARAVFIGTRPPFPDHFFEKMLTGDSADFAACYAPTDSEVETKPFTLRTIRKANPSLDHMPDLKKAILSFAARAKKDPGLLPAFNALHLNAGVEDVLESKLIEVELWRKIEGDAEPIGPTIWGVDLGESHSQSAIACYWPQTGRLEAISAFPQHPSLATRGLKDGVGVLYQKCNEAGELLVLGNHSSDTGELVRVAVERWGRPLRLCCDSWRKASLKDALDEADIMVPVDLRRMGPHDGGEDVRVFRKACVDGRVTPVVSLLLRSAMGAANTVTDGKGNTTITKKWGARDDAAAAAVLAVSSSIRVPPETSRMLYYGKV